MAAQWNTTGTAETEPRPSYVKALAIKRRHRLLEANPPDCPHARITIEAHWPTVR
jgi:hypothetical protein